MWMAQDNANPRRRCAFGTEEAARSYVDGLGGWSAFSDEDQRWRTITGLPAPRGVG